MEILAENTSFADFLDSFDGQFVEWVDGVVYKMAPIVYRHQEVQMYLRTLLDIYLELTSGGRTLSAPFIIRPTPNVARSPDIQLLLPGNMHRLRKYETYGAADLVVEVVSEGSYELDWKTKLKEYEFGRIGEYWIIDPIHQHGGFYVLKRQEFYVQMGIVNGIYHSTVLPRLKIPYDILWQDEFPTISDTLEMVKAMLNENQ